jgi:membrane protease YdiL (CAAX protease family)
VTAAPPAAASAADPAPPPPVQDTRWSELLLYLLGGFGLFAVAGVLVGRLAGPTTTILASLAAYWLNFLCFAGAAYFLGVRRQGLSWPVFGLRPFPLRWLGVGLLAAVALLPLRACAGLLAPLAEELYFRGLLHRWFWAHFSTQPWLRVLLSSGVFSLGHVDSAGAVASTFFLGILCALAYERTRSLWLPVAIHAVNNSLAVLLMYAVLALQPSLPAP